MSLTLSFCNSRQMNRRRTNASKILHLWFICANITDLFEYKMFSSSPAQDTLTTTFALLGKGTAAMSFTMAYIVSAEVYPTEVRNWGMGTSSVCARISGMAAPYIGDALVCKSHLLNQFKSCLIKGTDLFSVLLQFLTISQDTLWENLSILTCSKTVL